VFNNKKIYLYKENLVILTSLVSTVNSFTAFDFRVI